MMKSVALAVAAAALATPALAADPAVDAHGADLARAYDAKQAQKLLLSQGYTGVSELERLANGRWAGTAVKDGKTVIVGINLPKPVAASTTN